jgi:hypothetical protein
MKQSLGALEYFFPPDFVASLEDEIFCIGFCAHKIYGQRYGASM